MSGGPYRGEASFTAPRRCLRCGARTAGDRCVRCGAPAPPEGALRADALRIDCPRCGIALEPSRLAEWSAGFVYCVGCHGCFVPPADWEILVDRIAPLGAVPGDELAPVEKGPRLDGEIPCPVCRRTMERVRYDGGELVVDVCDLHGIWFDAAELAQALRETERDEGAPMKPGPVRAPVPVPDDLAGITTKAPARLRPPATPTDAPPEDDVASVVVAFVRKLFD
jgi:Zn-finger nucleic acid-binding protein